MITLDAIDRRILERLQQDGRLSNAELADKAFSQFKDVVITGVREGVSGIC